MQVVDQFGKPIEGIVVRKAIYGWKPNPLEVMRVNSTPFTSEREIGKTDAQGIVSLTSPPRWSNMDLMIHVGDLDQRVIFARNSGVVDRMSEHLRIDSGDIRAWEEKREFSTKPVYSKQVVIYRTSGPEQLLLDPDFLGTLVKVQADRSYPAIAADFIRRGAEMTPRILRTAADVAAADEDMIMRFGEVPDPQAIRMGTDAEGTFSSKESPYTIWLEFECRRGGLRLADEPYPYVAPFDGYARTIRFQCTVGGAGKQNLSGMIWVRRNGTPVRYGLMDFRISHRRGQRGKEDQDDVFPFINLWFNPSGSRNLERPGPGQFDTHTTLPSVDRVMLWRPQPLLLRHSTRIAAEFTDPDTDHSPRFGPAWFAEPRDAGAIPLVDEPVAPGK